jgi:phosphohistidine phosphatase SixA
MPEMIVLVRHGKAEPRSVLVRDQARKLTAKGREVLEKNYPAVFADIAEAAGPVTVLSSAATRTMQTAEVVCEALGIPTDEIVELNELTGQDEEGIIRELRDHEGVVIAVGHSPSIDEVASRLTGRMRSMLKGEALGLDATTSPTRMSVLFDCVPK